MDFPLRDNRLLVLVGVFDRILNRDDVNRSVHVDPVNDRGE